MSIYAIVKTVIIQFKRKNNSMNIRIAFRHMEKTSALEEHARAELAKLEKLINIEHTPIFVDLIFEEHKLRDNNRVELRVNVPHGHFMANAEGSDMYLLIGQVIDKMLAELRREKERKISKRDRPNENKDPLRTLKEDFKK